MNNRQEITGWKDKILFTPGPLTTSRTVKQTMLQDLGSRDFKCIEGVPGFTIVLARQDALLAAEGYARSVSLDLLAQWRGLEANGQFPFTPPTHALLAFAQALDELKMEGGVEGRNGRKWGFARLGNWDITITLPISYSRYYNHD